MKVEFVLDHDIFEESIRAIEQRATILDLGGHSPRQKQLAISSPCPVRRATSAPTSCPHPGLDFVADAQRIPLRNASIEAVICHSLLEHVFEPTQVAREMFRILKPDGVAFVYVPFLYAYHGDSPKKGAVDNYRFSLDAIHYMFQDFAFMRVQPLSRAVEAALRLLGARHRSPGEGRSRDGPVVDRLRGPQAGLYQASGYNIWLQKAEAALDASPGGGPRPGAFDSVRPEWRGGESSAHH